jgi:hypothetical protein
MSKKHPDAAGILSRHGKSFKDMIKRCSCLAERQARYWKA